MFIAADYYIDQLTFQLLGPDL